MKARKLIGWIACSPTPLTPPEIQAALSIKFDDEIGKFCPIANLDLRRICGPIVEVVDGYAQFVHFTVKE